MGGRRITSWDLGHIYDSRLNQRSKMTFVILTQLEGHAPPPTPQSWGVFQTHKRTSKEMASMGKGGWDSSERCGESLFGEQPEQLLPDGRRRLLTQLLVCFGPKLPADRC